jgi:hypothetical protein
MQKRAASASGRYAWQAQGRRAFIRKADPYRARANVKRPLPSALHPRKLAATLSTRGVAEPLLRPPHRAPHECQSAARQRTIEFSCVSTGPTRCTNGSKGRGTSKPAKVVTILRLAAHLFAGWLYIGSTPSL